MSAPPELGRWQFWLLNTIAVLALALVALNAILAGGNRSLQTEIQQRQQFINESLELSRLNTQVIRGLATLSAQGGDEELRELLAAHGIEFSFKPGTGTTQATPAREDGAEP